MATLICDVALPGGKTTLDSATDATYSVTYDRPVRLLAGGVTFPKIESAPNAFGWPWYEIHTNDSELVHPDDRGFGVMVHIEWTGPDGRQKSADALVAVTTADLDESGRALLSKLDLQATPVPRSDLVGAGSILARMSDVEAVAGQSIADAATATVATQTLPSRRAFIYARHLLTSTNSCSVAFLGDSKTEGTGVSKVAQRWQNLIMDKLRAQWPITNGDAGVGYIPAHYFTFYPLDLEPKRSPSGATSIGDDGGLGNRSVDLNPGSWVEWTGVTTGAAIWVGYTQGSDGWHSGTFEVLIDGAVAATQSANVTPTLGGRWLKVTTTPGTHTIRVRCASGSQWSARVDGIYAPTSSTGWHQVDASRAGATSDSYANGYATNSASVERQWEAMRNFPHPMGLVFVALGVNDMSGTVSAADYAKNAARIVQRIEAAQPKAGIVWLMAAMRVEDARSATPSDYPGKRKVYLDALRAAIGSHPKVTVVDEGDFWQPLNATPKDANAPVEQDPVGWLADNVHPSAFGSSLIAEGIAARLHD